MPTQDWRGRIEKLLNRVSGSDIVPDSNKKLIEEFYRELKVNDYSDASVMSTV